MVPSWYKCYYLGTGDLIGSSACRAAVSKTQGEWLHSLGLDYGKINKLRVDCVSLHCSYFVFNLDKDEHLDMTSPHVGSSVHVAECDPPFLDSESDRCRMTAETSFPGLH